MSKQRYLGLTGSNVRKRVTSAIAGVSVILAMILPAATAGAASNSLSLNSSAKEATKDSLFKVSLVLTAQDSIEAVQGYVTYDSSKVAYVPTENEYAAPWANDTGDTKGGKDYYQVSRYRLPPFDTGTSTVATLAFKALASSGTVSFGLASDKSVAMSNGNNVLSGVNGTSVSLLPAAGPNDPAKPGTTIPGTGTTPTRSTAASSTGDNGTAATAVAITSDDAKAAAKKVTDESKPAQVASAKSSGIKSGSSTTLIIVLTAIVLLIAGVIIYTLLRRRRPVAAGAAVTPSAVDPSAPGSVFAPPVREDNNPDNDEQK